MKTWRHLLLLGILTIGIQLCGAQYEESDWRERDQWMRVPSIFKWARIGLGDTVADIGCHEGYLSMHLAKAVGFSGQVFAVDIEDHRLRTLEQNAAQRKLDNITTILGEFDNPKLPEKKMDAVFVIDTYHEIQEFNTVLEHIRKSLKPGGRLVILEKLKDHARNKTRSEQARAHTLSPQHVKKELKEAGFAIIMERENLGLWKNEEDKKMWLLVGVVPGT